MAAGRPKKKVDLKKEQIKELASCGLTNLEIAAIANTSPTSLARNYGDIIKEGHQHRNGSLRRKQYEVAMGGNCSMLIWLGKQHLDQTDKQETIDGTDYTDLARLLAEDLERKS